MADINPRTTFNFNAHEEGAILKVFITPESTGYGEALDIGMLHSTLLELHVALQSDIVDWKNSDGVLNVKGEGEKLTLMIDLKKVNLNRTNSYVIGEENNLNPAANPEDAPEETVIKHLGEEESKLFRKEVASYAR